MGNLTHAEDKPHSCRLIRLASLQFVLYNSCNLFTLITIITIIYNSQKIRGTDVVLCHQPLSLNAHLPQGGGVREGAGRVHETRLEVSPTSTSWN